MDSPPPMTPPSNRSIRRLLAHPCDDDDDNHHHPHTLTPRPRKNTTISPSPLHLPIPLQDLLIISQSPYLDPPSTTPRRKSRTRTPTPASSMGLVGCASPRNVRRARRRLEKEIVREERELGPVDNGVERPRKRKQGRPKGASKKKLSVGSSLLSSSPLPGHPENMDLAGNYGIDGLWEVLVDLIMWKNVAKSTLWFGIGSIFFLSSSFSREFGFSITSAISHLGILILALAFFYDSFPQRQQIKWRGDFQLTEENILRAARVVLPVANAVIAKTREIFSGEPSMTLKVAPILLFTTKYGHLITLWRLFATGFFLSFTAPKLYSNYSQQIHKQVEVVRNYVSEAWKSCRHKRFIAASSATVFWNLFSAKTRIFAAFISVVILRYHHQQHIGKEKISQRSNKIMEEVEEEQQAMDIAE